ncbi:MAG: hypothetical protein CMJ49_13685, partial [Planctomycetaceae bacterium]|nr:hypothetical protein [Planctomycetaceae bacterium]
MHERLRHLLLGRTAQFVSDHPRWTLLVAALITVAAIALTVDRLEFQADRNALVSADLDWNQRYLQYLEMFRGNDDLVVIVRVPNEEDGRARAEQYVVQLEQRLLSQPDHIESVYARIDRTQVSPRALRLLPPDQFEQNMARMEQQAPILQWPTIGGFLTAVAARAAPDATTDSLAPMGRMLDRLNVGFATGAINDDLFSPLTSPNGDDWQYLSTKDDPESDEDELLLMIVAPNPVIGQLDAYADVAQTIRAAIARTSEQMPGIESGLTGVPVIEADETDVSMRDSMKCSILAVLLIATLLIIAFHSFRWPLLAVTALLIGVAWSFGFLTLAIGHLQILSVVFTIILLGLGIDFGIHLISRFELVRHRYPDGTVGFAPAMVDTMQTVGPGIITGAVTTALAFGTTLLTSFRGMAEMGLIAGVGILLCLIAMGTVFPALMRTFRKKWKHVMPMDQRPVDLFPVERLMPLVRHPGWVIISAVVVIGAAAVGISQLRYNYNLESLLPHGVDSVKWQKVYRQHSRQSVWFGASICRNLDEAKYRAAAFRALSTVDSVQGVGLLFPEDEPAKLQRMAHARAAIGSALTDPPA